MIDKREQAPRFPLMVFLENEVKDLADAHVQFLIHGMDCDHPPVQRSDEELAAV